MRVDENAVKDKQEGVERHGLNEEDAHAEKVRRQSKKVVVELDSGCNDKDPLHSVADIPGVDG